MYIVIVSKIYYKEKVHSYKLVYTFIVHDRLYLWIDSYCNLRNCNWEEKKKQRHKCIM